MVCSSDHCQSIRNRKSVLEISFLNIVFLNHWIFQNELSDILRMFEQFYKHFNNSNIRMQQSYPLKLRGSSHRYYMNIYLQGKRLPALIHDHQITHQCGFTWTTNERHIKFVFTCGWLPHSLVLYNTSEVFLMVCKHKTKQASVLHEIQIKLLQTAIMCGN